MNRERRLIWIPAALAALTCLLIVPGCGGAGGAGGDGDEGAVVPLAKGDAAPDVAFQSLEGKDVRLADSDGTILLVDFWATWCAPCREEIPMLNELQASYREQGLRILAVSEEESDVIRDFVEEYDVQYPNLVATPETAARFGILGLPTAYLIGPDGTIAETFFGPKPRKVLEKKIRELLEAAPST